VSGRATGPTPVRERDESAELATQLRLALGRLTREMRRTSAAGITPSQLSALVNLDELGPLRLGDLAAREGVTPSTTSRTVDALVRQGLVERGTDPEDGRASVVTATEPGRELLASLRTRRDAVLAEAVQALSASDRRRLRESVSVLGHLVTHLRSECGGSPGT
jgi:DNA-binding MarR family transcriptional regulator